MTLVPKRCAGLSILVLSLCLSLAAFASADGGKHSGTAGGSQETDVPDAPSTQTGTPAAPPPQTQAPDPQGSATMDGLQKQVDALAAHNADLKKQLASLNQTYDGGAGGASGASSSTDTVKPGLASKTPRTAPKIPIAADASGKSGGDAKGPSFWDGLKGNIGTYVALGGFGMLAFGLCFMNPIMMGVGAGLFVLGLLGGPLLQTFT
jgi:hypothetical protein